MGISPAPQMANLFCYVAEKRFVEQQQQPSTLNTRYIDDVFGPQPIPTPHEYGMEYKISAQGESVPYIGIRVYRTNGRIRTTMYDREENYPHHIMRYPCRGSVLSKYQWAGVILGRLVAAQFCCSTLSDFKQSVFVIACRAVERGYRPHELKTIFRRFLKTKWHAADLRQTELFAWFKDKALPTAENGCQNLLPLLQQRHHKSSHKLAPAPMWIQLALTPMWMQRASTLFFRPLGSTQRSRIWISTSKVVLPRAPSTSISVCPLRLPR